MFIEKIYRGNFDARLFDGPPRAVDEARVSRILQTYREILKDYPPEMLEERGGLSSGLIGKMRSAGLFGLNIEREYGGQGLNLHEFLRVVEEMVKIDISIAITFLAHLSIGVKAVRLFGNPLQKEKYLPRAASGEMIFAFALTEPRIGSDAQRIETTALPGGGDYYVLNGRKAYITNANYAGGFTVFAQLDSEQPGFMGAFIVEGGWDGVKVGKEMPKMGLKASSTAAIQFRNVHVPAENMIGKPGDGFKIAMSVLNYGRLGLGVASAALMESSARDMLKRASSRVQFQVPIKNFQLIQEKIARAEVNASVSAAMNRFIAGALEKDPLQALPIETSHCKLFGTTRAWDAVYDALQVAGGSGYLKTLPYEKRMRDFRVATVFEGTTEIHSIYPALYGMRQVGRWFKEAGLSGLTMELVKAGSKKSAWPVRLGNRTMQSALREAKKCARLLRVLLLAGVLFHGKEIQRGEIGGREFFLRRITTLSVYMFGLLALLSEAQEKESSGNLAERDLHILDYFAAESREVRRRNYRLFDTGRERLGAIVLRDLERDSCPRGADGRAD